MPAPAGTVSGHHPDPSSTNRFRMIRGGRSPPADPPDAIEVTGPECQNFNGMARFNGVRRTVLIPGRSVPPVVMAAVPAAMVLYLWLTRPLADEVWIRQVLINFVNNTSKHPVRGKGNGHCQHPAAHEEGGACCLQPPAYPQPGGPGIPVRRVRIRVVANCFRILLASSRDAFHDE